MPKLITDEGETKDTKVLYKVIDRWMKGAGCAVDVQIVVNMLNALLKTYGTNFSVEKAFDALDNLTRTASQIRQAIQKEYGTFSE